MKGAGELYGVLKSISWQDANMFPAIVKQVNGDNTIDVDVDGRLIADVLYQSNDDCEKGIKIIPAIDSVVVIGRIGDAKSDEYCVILYGEIESHSIEIESVKLLTDKDGFLLQKGDENLRKLVTDLVDAILTERHNTYYGPTISLTPASKLKFEQIKTRAENLLKDA
jgi:hypothetical protein